MRRDLRRLRKFPNSHRGGAEDTEGEFKVKNLCELSVSVVNLHFPVWVAAFAALGSLRLRKCLDSRFHENDAEKNTSRQLYFFNTSRAITMRMTSEAPSVIMRLR